MNRAPFTPPSPALHPAHESVPAQERTDSRSSLVEPDRIDRGQWATLAAHAIEPNVFYRPEWALPALTLSRQKGQAYILAARPPAEETLIGLLPVTSSWQAYRLPLPLLVSHPCQGLLGTPLLHAGCEQDAAQALLDAARVTGARALVLRDVPRHGKAMEALVAAAQHNGLTTMQLSGYDRATLHVANHATATENKASRNLRKRLTKLQQRGEVTFAVARNETDFANALEEFLALEASGWKGKEGTALASNAGDLEFVRQATMALAALGDCEIAMLRLAGQAIAAAIMPRHLDRAYGYKIGMDEAFASFSPGSQLVVAMRPHLDADPKLQLVDSSQNSREGLANQFWPGRMAMADMFIALRHHDPVASALAKILIVRDTLRQRLRTLYRRYAASRR